VGCLLLGQTLQQAEDDRSAITVRQAVDLLVESYAEIVSGAVDYRGRRALAGSSFLVSTTDRSRPNARGNTARHAMEPGSERINHAERTRLAGQDEERCLEDVVSVVGLAQNRPRDAEDQRAVTLDEGREGELGRWAVAGQEPSKQLAIRKVPCHPSPEEAADLQGDGVSIVYHDLLRSPYCSCPTV
jgi:hypothetical protein